MSEETSWTSSRLALTAAVELWRKHRGLTREELALQAQVFPEDLVDIEQNFLAMKAPLGRIAAALDVRRETIARTAANITYGGADPGDIQAMLRLLG